MDSRRHNLYPVSNPVIEKRLEEYRRSNEYIERKSANNPILQFSYDGNYEEFVENIVEYRNRHIRIVLLKNGKLVKTQLIIPNENKIEWLRNNFFEGESNDETFIPNKYPTDKILVYKSRDVLVRAIKQVFRDNSSNTCVFNSIRSAVMEYMKNVSFKTQANYRTMLNKLDRLEPLYRNGVPQDEIKKIADTLGVVIEIDDVIGNEYLKFGVQQKRVKIRLRNVRENHVEHYTNRKEIEVDDDWIMEKYRELKEKGEFYIVKNSVDRIRRLETADCTFVCPDKNAEIFKVLNKQIEDCGIDALQNPSLNKFLLEGRIINSTPVSFSPFTERTKLWDMKRAYVQMKECPYYAGILMKIWVYQKTSCIVGLGIYQVKIDRDTKMSRKFGLNKGGFITLPSPELQFWKDNGVSYSVIGGCWGSGGDLEFNYEIVNGKLYNEWIGKLSMNENYPNKSYTFAGNSEFASHLKSLYPFTRYWTNGEIEVKIPHKKLITYHHIYAFITSYCRITMLEAMKGKNIQAVLLDGIYTEDEITNPLFVEKEIGKKWCYSVDSWYSMGKKKEFVNGNFTGNSLLYGSGGCGKSWSVFNDLGLLDVLYVVPTRELGEKSGRKWTTIHKLIGENCIPYCEEFYIPAVIFIDELTMIPDCMIEKAIQMYGGSMILIGGDVDGERHYQCRNGRPSAFREIYNNWKVWNMIEYCNDYRAKDVELKKLKCSLREYMKEIYTDGEVGDSRKIRDWLKNRYTHISIDSALKMSSDSDIWIVGTHKVGDLIDKEKHTIHAFQGQTISDKKVFITNDYFEYAMPFTAVSRVERLDQIVFVNV